MLLRKTNAFIATLPSLELISAMLAPGGVSKVPVPSPLEQANAVRTAAKIISILFYSIFSL
jgi:hypothetical protein